MATYETFRDIGRDIFLAGLISSHGGNLSTREDDRITITRRGSMLGALAPSDLVTTRIQPCADDADCSRELVVHRGIYQACDASAVAHAHSVHTVYRSLVGDSIEPIDSESKYVLGASIPVLSPAETIASPEAAEMLAEAFAAGAKIAVLRSHGPFAIGATLAEAFYHITCLEASCRILDLRDSVGLPLK
jgi:L-fuculose-phosphate aldolase